MRRSNARTQALDSLPAAAEEMESSKPHVPRPSASHRPFLPRDPPPAPKRRGARSRSFFFLPLLILAAAAAVLGLYAASERRASRSFAIVIDAGSTGTRIHVIGYRDGRGAVPTLDLELTASMKVSPGLSAHTGSPEEAEQSLMELLEFGKLRVPRDRWGGTEVRLMATAGMRLLEAGIREKILESCRRVLRDSVFLFQGHWASVISGADEGIYAWVAANYALGTLGGDPKKTTGIVELGGASAQVTFVTSEPIPPEFSHVIKLGEIEYSLYSHSFLHLGQNVAYEKLQELLSSEELTSRALPQASYSDPCTPRGFIRGMASMKLSVNAIDSKTKHRPTALAVGNFTKCRSTALAFLQKGKDNCRYHRCRLGSAFIPKLKGRFLATENFFYTSKFFGLEPKLFLSDLMLAGEQFCNADWSELKKKYRFLDEEELSMYCFSSAYIVALLHDSLGISMNDEKIDFANNVDGVPVDWALGAFIRHKALDRSLKHSNWITSVLSYDFSTLLPVLLVPALILMACSISKWRRPHFKTIYDLEKGRYIITRVNR